MPIKQVVCCVCKQTVNKAQTLAVGDNERACRTHSGVKELASKTQEIRKVTEQIGSEKLKAAHRRPSHEPVTLDPTCFSCRAIGLRADMWYLEILKCHERYELTYGVAPDLFDDTKRNIIYAPLKGKTCLWMIPYRKGMRLYRDLEDLAHMIGFAALCGKCCEVRNIDYLPKVNIDELSAFGAVYESFVRPELTKMVAKEISENN